jgi:Protein of unknown function (DUF3592)/Mu transposase, C-terminal
MVARAARFRCGPRRWPFPVPGHSVGYVSVLLGIWLAVAGGVAVLAGATAARRVRRLRASGQTAWAEVVARATEDAEAEGGPWRVLLQFRLPDGQLIERATRRMRPGQKVLIWYDPADPGDVLVYGQDGRYIDSAFAAVGIALILIGAAFIGH